MKRWWEELGEELRWWLIVAAVVAAVMVFALAQGAYQGDQRELTPQEQCLIALPEETC